MQLKDYHVDNVVESNQTVTYETYNVIFVLELIECRAYFYRVLTISLKAA